MSVVYSVWRTVRTSCAVFFLMSCCSFNPSGSFSSSSSSSSSWSVAAQEGSEQLKVCTNPREKWNTTLNECDCLPGLSGWDCQMCDSDFACQLIDYNDAITTEGEEADDGTTINQWKCHNGLVYETNIPNKTYTCELSDTLKALYEDGSFDIQCHQPSRTCQAALYITEYGLKGYHMMDCQFTGCHFENNIAGANCDLMSCQCGRFCSDLVASMVEGSFSGNPVEVVVDEETGVIDLQVEGSYIPLIVTCTASNCYEEVIDDGNSTTTVPNNEEDDTGGSGLVNTLEDKFQEDWRGVTAVSIVMLFIISLCVVLVIGCACCFQIRLQTSKQGLKEQDYHHSLPLPPLPPPQSNDGPEQGSLPSLTAGQYLPSLSSSSTTMIQSLSFDNISITVQQQSMKKTILDHVSGRIESGQVLALLGASGAGKSSLLNLLAGIPPPKGLIVQGKIQVNDHPRSSKYFRQLTAYVQHQASDALFPTLSVQECLQYSALLRLPMTLSIRDKQQHVNELLEELQLSHIQHCRIGFSASEDHQQSSSSSGRISTGERRRVSIGMELITNPSILFLDEPTTGLDSATANSIVELLHTRATQQSMMVIMSIHQPSAKCFESFDKLLVLTHRGGKTLYMGEALQASTALIDAGFPRLPHDNEADHLLDVAASLDQESMERLYQEGTLPIITNTPSVSSKKEEGPTPQNDSNGTSNDNDDDEVNHDNISSDETKTTNGRSSLLLEIQILLNRTIKNLFRNPSLLFMHVLISVLLATIAGFVFEDVTDDLAGFQNRTGAFYFTLIFFAVSSLSSVDVLLSEERTIFLREAGATYYSTMTYFGVKSILDALTLRVLPATLFAFIFYFLMGLQSFYTKFVVFWATVLLFNVAAGSIILCISVCAPSVGAANLVATVIFLIQLLFGGLFLNVSSMSDSIAWIQHFSIFYYAFELCMTNEFEGIILDFDAPEYPSIPVRGEIFLLTLGLDINNQVQDMFALLAIAVGCNFLAYILLYLCVPTTRELNTA